MNVFVQDKVWRYLKEHGPSQPRVVADALGVSHESGRHACQKLAQRGCATAVGRTHHRAYTAIGACPKSNRGKTEGALVNLARGRHLGLLAQARRRGRLYLPRPTHPLDIVMRGKP